MSLSVRDSVIKRTAEQLGIKEDQVTMETKIPDLYNLVTLVVMDTCRVIFIKDTRKQNTVGAVIKAIESTPQC